ncbi:MAG: hypothetical protein H4O13_15115 [Xanthomonadales bacterium]|nr:hypothetical protein [Xanthomonadales bacterium]
MKYISAVLFGLLVALLLVGLHALGLLLWNNYIDPLFRLLFGSGSGGRYAWDGESLHAIDLIPIILGWFVYYAGIGITCEYAEKYWTAWLHVRTAAWTALVVVVLAGLFWFAFYLFMGYAAGGFSGILLGLYGAATLCASGWGGYSAVREVSPPRRV